MTAFRTATLAAAILFANLAAVQSHRAVAQDQTVSQLDLQRPQDVNTLNGHLARLAENPRDVSALIGAGEAALALDDARAATGFLARANEISPSNGRIKAGLGRAMLDMQNPGEALKLFGEAVRLGYPDSSFLSDRGLARDLTGDAAGAQKDYQAALRTTPDDAELIRRYAVSLGISGQVDASERVIKSLLYKGDRGAWRDRAFVLAMNGRRDEARDIAVKSMPSRLAVAIQPYLDRMQALNPAQRAAAVHFGNFPAEVRMAAVQPQQPVVQPVGPQRPVAMTEKEQRAARRAGKRQQQQAKKAAETAVRTIPTAPKQPQRTAAAAATPVMPSSARAESQPIPPPPPTEVARPTPPAVQNVPEPAPQPKSTTQLAAADAPRPVQGPPAPEPALVASAPTVASEGRAQAAASSTPTPAPAPVPPTQLSARTLADIMRELQVPDAEKQVNAEAVNLADLDMIQQQRKTAKAVAAEKARADAAVKAKAAADAKAKAEAAEKAKLAKNPSRSWVQVGTGRSLSALAFTMKGLRKKYESLAAKDAWTASWGQTNRLVVGPFASFDKAKDYEERLKKGGADAFAWRSDAGEIVEKLAN